MEAVYENSMQAVPLSNMFRAVHREAVSPHLPCSCFPSVHADSYIRVFKKRGITRKCHDGPANLMTALKDIIYEKRVGYGLSRLLKN